MLGRLFANAELAASKRGGGKRTKTVWSIKVVDQENATGQKERKCVEFGLQLTSLPDGLRRWW
jgi:hypothetical protein